MNDSSNCTISSPLPMTHSVPLTEAWGDTVDPRDANSGFDFHPLVEVAHLDDRLDGKCRPLYETETDLARIRAGARRLGRLTPFIHGAFDALANYTFGSGTVFRVHAPEGNELPRRVAQTVLDELIDENDLCGFLDRELHTRCREDGEAFLRLSLTPQQHIALRFLEPEQITEPAQPRPLEDWLDVADQFVSSWSFGVHTRLDEPAIPLGYHVVHDAAGRHWDYLPAARVEHIRRNTPRNAKRGVSDLLCIQGDLEREAVLRRNTAEGAALQAAIAWILQPANGEPATLGYPAGEMPVSTRLTPAGTGYEKVRRYPPGTILRPSAGLEYKPGPLGSERIPHFLQVSQAILRAVGQRWSLPEFLISGDASNANYASTVMAESPFVKAREADQQFFRRHFQSICWKVLNLAWEAGRFDRCGLSWSQLERLLTVHIAMPAVATRDPLALAQTQALQMQAGILSRRTAASQAGLDFDGERRQIHEERGTSSETESANESSPETN